MTRIRKLITLLYARPCCATCEKTLDDRYVAVAPPEGIVRYWVHPAGGCEDTTLSVSDEALRGTE